jgi:hypothetical protein
MNEDILTQNPYLYIADVCGLSERTIRNAFNRHPITFGTAAKIAKNFNIPARCFRCIEDRRGRPKASKR